MDNEVLIKVEDVSKKFCRNLKRSLWYGLRDITMELLGMHKNSELRKDEFWAVNNVSFEVRRGECLGLIGHNGAGKSTLLKMLNGLIKPDKGRIRMKGRIGALIELGAGFNPILTGRENIYNNGAVLGFSKKEIDKKFDAIVDFAEIWNFIDTPVQNYSSGMKVRLGFAVAVQMEPDIFILDEVLAVGDAAFRVKCFNQMNNILSNAAVIFVSHNMPQITRISDRVLLLDHGKSVNQWESMGEIIARYNSRIDLSGAPILQGNGKVKISHVRLENEEKKTITRLVSGSSFYLVLSIDFFENFNLNEPRLLITISNEEDVNIAQILEYISPLKDKKFLTVRMLFERTLFNAGRYSVTASLLIGKRGELACVVRRATIFDVVSEISGYASVIFKPQEIELSYNHE